MLILLPLCVCVCVSATLDDVLARDAGECVICLEELQQGDTIARLPCLCIYHKSCIDSCTLQGHIRFLPWTSGHRRYEI
ncbi:hypothetical protein CHARACLAT_017160 [Characodon lateralis]|uniref:E3 ubiquitin-protein ligase ZNRF1 n=1 Tax=Characodon lateralis TaxID=208331 RepID=A0ABU7D7G4_9TELE|nr:hypothetical protein [Characodon lateralis]